VAALEEVPEHHMEEEAEVASTVAEAEASEVEVEIAAEVVHLGVVPEVEVAHQEEDAVALEVAEAALAQVLRCSSKPMKDSKASMFYVERTMLSLPRTRLQGNQFTTRSESAQR